MVSMIIDGERLTKSEVRKLIKFFDHECREMAGEFFDKCLGACENLIRGLERPAVQLIVNSHPRVSGCISMVKCDPPSRMIQAGPPHQKMRLHAIGPDDVDAPLCDE